MEPLTEEVNPNSPPAMEQPGPCMKPQVTARHGGRGDGGSWHGAGEQLPEGQGPEAPDVPRQSPPSPTARAQSQGPALHSPTFPPSPRCSPSPGWLEALGEQAQGAVGGSELPGPQTMEWGLAREERERELYVGQELPQWGKESGQELSQREDKYQDLSQPELSHGEVVTSQEPCQKQDVNVQELHKQDDKRDQELSEGEIHPDLCHQEFERHQELSKWLDTRIQELFQEENNSNKMFLLGEHSVDQELSEGEIRRYPKLSRERGDSDKKESQKDLECIIIHTIWVNPKYPQLLQDLDAAPQDSAKATASPALAEQVKAAGAQSQGPALPSPSSPPGPSAPLAEQVKAEGAQSQGPALPSPSSPPGPSAPLAEQVKAAGAQSQGPALPSPSSPPGPSAPQAGAQALREQPAPPKKRLSRFREALRALLRWPCLRAQPENQCPPPAPGPAPQPQSLPGATRAACDVQGSGTSAPCRENGLAEA